MAEHDWLSLIEISGPFLAIPVLKEVFPLGLEELDGIKRKRLRQAYEEWREALETEDPQLSELHAAWIDEVLSRGLELDEDGKGDVLKRKDWCAANLNVSLPEHGVTLTPDLAVIDEQQANKPLMLIHTYGQDVDLDATLKSVGWAATPADCMVHQCRAIGCRLGLVTNGERWMLVDAPVGAVTSFASWYARIWSQEPITLQAFVHLLGIRRFFVDEAEQLPALFERSLQYQDEVTNALGEQVRRAVEVLIQALDKADQDRDRELLRDVKEPVLYEAALTVMMRLVFLLSAEERGLLLLGDQRYEANYALSTLRMQLRKESGEILERRWDAWSRLLAIFRAVFGGIEHENLRLPALGGSLFDPDRFPFLEGRAKGSDWRTDAARPLPIDNRTVLLLLEAIQQFQGRTLSYRALDVEQIGYVYEGLLERTVKRTDDVTLEMDATKSAKTPWVKLAELDSARLDGMPRLAALLQERSGSSASRVRNDLAKPIDDTISDRLLATCHGDTALRDRIKPFAYLVRNDPWGYPLVYPAGAFIVTTGSDRRETGTHYTPKSLTEAIVTETLTPIVYVGPAEGTPRDQWVLKSPAQLLDLKICDPAMGSGAFLVQACRWLADRLVEAWSQAEGKGKTVSVDGEVLDAPDIKEPMPRETETRNMIARRLIAERCLYGVDLNPLAVELAKLSIWLVTLAKDRPFGFLDHNLRCGDSLLGIIRLDQLTELSMKPGEKGQQRMFVQDIKRAVHDAIKLRQELREIPIGDIHDVEAMARLDADARRTLELPRRIADALIAEIFVSCGNGSALDNALLSLAIRAGQVVDGNQDAIDIIIKHAKSKLKADLHIEKESRRPFHWPLEFPEVFANNRLGFDAVLGNPPFLGGKKITTSLGEKYRSYIVFAIASNAVGAADLCAYFLLRSIQLISGSGSFGLIATNSICEGSTRTVGLGQFPKLGVILYRAVRSLPWPGHAGVNISLLWGSKSAWSAPFYLDGSKVDLINEYLSTSATTSGEPFRLERNKGLAFAGTGLGGDGFIISKELGNKLLNEAVDGQKINSEIIYPILTGRDITSDPQQIAARYVINFHSWPKDRAQRYATCFRIVTENVKPYRDTLTKQIHEKDYWKFWDKREESYKRISKFDKVLVAPRVSKLIVYCWVKRDQVFSDQVVVFTNDEPALLSIFQSSIHQEWAWTYCTTIRDAGIRYAPSNAIENFPLPREFNALREIGFAYQHGRQCYLLKENIGLTELYNRINNQSNTDPEIENLRLLHRKLDCAVAAAYGWDDLELCHDFVTSKQGVRFTLSDKVRKDVLARLLDLNHQCHAEEIAQGLHIGTATSGITHAPRVGRMGGDATPQRSLDLADVPTSVYLPNNPARAILEFLNSRAGWHAKAEILAATALPTGHWNTAIKDLISDSKVERKGEKRGTYYRSVRTGQS